MENGWYLQNNWNYYNIIVYFYIIIIRIRIYYWFFYSLVLSLNYSPKIQKQLRDIIITSARAF